MNKLTILATVSLLVVAGVPATAQVASYNQGTIAAACASGGAACVAAVQAAVNAIQAGPGTAAQKNSALGALGGQLAGIAEAATPAQRRSLGQALQAVAVASTNPRQRAVIAALATNLARGNVPPGLAQVVASLNPTSGN